MTDPAGLGREFAEALAAKDFERIATEIVDPDIDFRGLPPRRAWEASSAEQLVAEILNEWLEPSDLPEGLIDCETGEFADRTASPTRCAATTTTARFSSSSLLLLLRHSGWEYRRSH